MSWLWFKLRHQGHSKQTFPAMRSWTTRVEQKSAPKTVAIVATDQNSARTTETHRGSPRDKATREFENVLFEWEKVRSLANDAMRYDTMLHMRSSQFSCFHETPPQLDTLPVPVEKACCLDFEDSQAILPRGILI